MREIEREASSDGKYDNWQADGELWRARPQGAAMICQDHVEDQGLRMMRRCVCEASYCNEPMWDDVMKLPTLPVRRYLIQCVLTTLGK